MPTSPPPLATGAKTAAKPLTLEDLIDRALPGRRCPSCNHTLRRCRGGPATFECRGPVRHRVCAFATSPMAGSHINALLWLSATEQTLEGASARKIERELGLNHRIANAMVARLLDRMSRSLPRLQGRVAVGVYEAPPPGPMLLAAVEHPIDRLSAGRLRLAPITGALCTTAARLLPQWLEPGSVALLERVLVGIPDLAGVVLNRYGDTDRRLQQLNGDLEPWVRARGGWGRMPPEALAAFCYRRNVGVPLAEAALQLLLPGK